MGVRIIHMADMHFDAPFTGLAQSGLFPSLGDKRRREMRETFARAVGYRGLDNRLADLLLIAGDLFENEYTGMSTLQFVRECFESIPDTLVFISPGNHDHLGPGSCYRLAAFPDHVHVFGMTQDRAEPAKAGTGEGGIPILGGRGLLHLPRGDDRIERVDIPDLGTCVYGAAFHSAGEYTPFPGNGFHTSEDPEDEPRIHLMVLHADLDGKAKDGRYNPLSPAVVAASGLHYLALGHVHGGREVLRAGNTPYAYSGVLEGHGFDEPGLGGILTGEVDRNGHTISFIPISRREYRTLDVDAGDCRAMEEIEKKMRQVAGPWQPETFYRVQLKGLAAPGVMRDPAELEEKAAADGIYLRVTDQTRTVPELPGDGARFKTLRDLYIGEILLRMRETRPDAPEREHMEQVLRTAMTALERSGG